LEKGQEMGETKCSGRNLAIGGKGKETSNALGVCAVVIHAKGSMIKNHLAAVVYTM
jgi:hypothetical protein